ncbi:hypothetical protein BJ508DRAFT_315298 [Ascobolus immersus RN42]|uniref:Uncharacterized protein n=1 Tax=Ascobolus immersus RN42 TaxID=1160509 RepID=A0A3N4HQ32_ASCIM|nr:hypothetical protein BJ508DRAFT_315298 [Ascobolus immersus RN42]
MSSKDERCYRSTPTVNRQSSQAESCPIKRYCPTARPYQRVTPHRAVERRRSTEVHSPLAGEYNEMDLDDSPGNDGVSDRFDSKEAARDQDDQVCTNRQDGKGLQESRMGNCAAVSTAAGELQRTVRSTGPSITDIVEAKMILKWNWENYNPARTLYYQSEYLARRVQRCFPSIDVGIPADQIERREYAGVGIEEFANEATDGRESNSQGPFNGKKKKAAVRDPHWGVLLDLPDVTTNIEETRLESIEKKAACKHYREILYWDDGSYELEYPDMLFQVGKTYFLYNGRYRTCLLLGVVGEEKAVVDAMVPHVQKLEEIDGRNFKRVPIPELKGYDFVEDC